MPILAFNTHSHCISLEAGYYNEEYSNNDVGNSNKVPKPN